MATDKQLKANAMADIATVQEALRHWDPIGVLPGPGEDEGPMDEYDSYAPHILSLLMQGCGAPEIQAHLILIRTRSMGLDPYPATDSRIARELADSLRSRTKE
jgi:hypothetical protein